jgi:acyl carrier protein
MTNAEIRSIALATLKSIAPEIDEADLRSDRPLRNQVDLDSMDWLNFLLGLHEKLKVEIPEADYAKLVSLDDVVTYLTTRLSAGSGSPSQ